MALIEPGTGFTLADLKGNLPDNLPAGGGAAVAEAPEPPKPDKPEPTPDPEPDETPEPEQPEATKPAKPEEEDDDAPRDLSEALSRQEAAGREKEKTTKAEKERTAADAQEKPAEPAANTRDADLDKIQLAPQAHERTRKVLNDVKAHARTARDRADKAEKEATELRQRVADLELKTKSVEPPKELQEKLKQYEERIRELDITKDPQIVEKFDAKITKNNDAIVGILKQFQYDKRQIKGEGDKVTIVDDPQAIPELLRQGLTMRTLKPLADKLEEGGFIDEAEAIRDAVRDNARLGKEKQAEIDSWKSGYETRKTQREEQSKAASEQRQQAIAKHRDSVLNADVEALAKNMPFLNPPPAPAPNDPPAIAKAKQEAQAAFSAAQAAVKADLALLDVGSAPPEKQAEVAGRVSAYAIQAALLKRHAIPNLMKSNAALTARVKELEGEMERIRGAGKLSRVHGGAPSTGVDRSRPEPRSLDEALGDGPQ